MIPAQECNEQPPTKNTPVVVPQRKRSHSDPVIHDIPSRGNVLSVSFFEIVDV